MTPHSLGHSGIYGRSYPGSLKSELDTVYCAAYLSLHTMRRRWPRQRPRMAREKRWLATARSTPIPKRSRPLFADNPFFDPADLVRCATRWFAATRWRPGNQRGGNKLRSVETTFIRRRRHWRRPVWPVCFPLSAAKSAHKLSAEICFDADLRSNTQRSVCRSGSTRSRFSSGSESTDAVWSVLARKKNDAHRFFHARHRAGGRLRDVRAAV